MAIERARLSHIQMLKLAGSASALALVCMSGAARAQDTSASEAQTASPDAEGDDAIIVTGIRASLSAAQEIKRNSDTVVDAI
ncbi:MAG TPA: hypothetical protein VM662_07060, partial [Sphingomonas sp.]|nr:hypothetical protein [Sphingomonas sp.]